MGGTVSARNRSPPAITTTQTTTTAAAKTSSASSTNNTAQNMTYTAAGSATAGAIILIGLMVIIYVINKRLKTRINKHGSPEMELVLRNELHRFDNDIELPDNPLYVTLQHMDEFGNTSDQKYQPIVLTTDMKSKPERYTKTNVFPDKISNDHGNSSMSIYAVPNKNTGQIYEIEVNDGNVYEVMNKPNRSITHDAMQTQMHIQQ